VHSYGQEIYHPKVGFVHAVHTSHGEDWSLGRSQGRLLNNTYSTVYVLYILYILQLRSHVNEKFQET
jgi:hypothetical protein